MAEAAYAYVTLIPVAKGFQSAIAKELAGVPELGQKAGLNLGGKMVSGFGTALKGAGVVAGVTAAAVAAAVVAFKPAIDAASSFYAEFEGVNQVFGDAAGSVQTFAANAATNLGISETSALNAAKQFGIFATSAGLVGQSAANFSTDLVQAAADLGSFADVPVDQTLAAIQSGLMGQSEPLRQFGIFLDENTVKAYAMDNGLGDVYDNMTQNEKTLVRQAALMEQMGVQANDFTNYADTYGNAIKTIEATFADLTTEIGNALMPMVEYMAINFRDALIQLQDPTTTLGEKWAEVTGAFSAFGDTVMEVFGRIDLEAVIGGILDFVQMLINGFSQLVWIGGEVGDILGKVFSGDFAGAGSQVSTFMTRYNSFVDGLYDKADKSVAAAVGNRIAANNKELYEAMNGLGKFEKTVKKFSFTPKKAADNSAAEAAAKTKAALKALIQDTKKDLIANRKEYNKAVADANKDYADAQKDITLRYDKAIAEATKKRDQALAGALKSYNENVARVNEQAAKDLADIVQQSMNRLRDAYRSAAEVNIADMFASDSINKNVTGLIDGLRDKLTKSRALLENAARLASAGFSQTFIEQVVSAGAETGNELAQGILNATPDQQRELQDLFTVIDQEASHGMDQLAQTLYEKNGLATEELKNMYASVLEEQRIALAEQKVAYDNAVAEIMVAFEEEIAQAKTTRDEALQDAENTLNEALLKANQDFVDELDKIHGQFKEKVNAFKKDAKALASEISALNSAVASAKSSAQTKITGLRTLIPMATGGLVTGPTPALVGEAGPELVIPLDRFQSLVEANGGNGKTVNYFAAPNQSIDSEAALFQAMRRAKVVANW